MAGVNGPATIKATLDGVPVGATLAGTNGGQWRANLDLSPGAHQLSVTAYHTSGQFSTNAASWFTNSAAPDRTINAFDAVGQLTQRIWLSSNGTTNRTQNLSWDAKGRLWKVVERDSGNSGYDWTAVYDAFDRRLQTTATMVTNGVAITAQAKTIRSYFDPGVEFLEIGLSYDGQATWKLHGPDLNGAYGGMQGVGGVEAVQTGYSEPVILISDARGNVVQQYDTWTKSLTYSSARPTGYGAAPGYEPVALGYGASLGEASAWRGKWKDITGYYWLGKRYYAPQSGSWLSYDSVWNVRDPNWFTFCGDDPINYFDPNGEAGLNYFQVLAPATYSASGARPYSGSLRGDLRVAGGFYGATLPVQAPGRLYTSEPVQRSLQVLGGLTEASVGVAGVMGTSPTVGGAILSGGAIVHGIDNIQAGVRGTATGTENILMSIGASPTWASAGNSVLGVGLTLGSSLTRVSASSPTTTWADDLPAGSGSTDRFGNMTLSSLGTGLDRAQVALHENVHSILSPSAGGIVNNIRADIRMGLYQGSQFFKYTEEALAETTAQLGTRNVSGLSFSDALMTGLRFPLVNNYGLQLSRVGVEAVGGTAAFGGSMYLAGQSDIGASEMSLGKKPH